MLPTPCFPNLKFARLTFQSSYSRIKKGKVLVWSGAIGEPETYVTFSSLDVSKETLLISLQTSSIHQQPLTSNTSERPEQTGTRWPSQSASPAIRSRSSCRCSADQSSSASPWRPTSGTRKPNTSWTTSLGQGRPPGRLPWPARATTSTPPPAAWLSRLARPACCSAHRGQVETE